MRPAALLLALPCLSAALPAQSAKPAAKAAPKPADRFEPFLKAALGR